jgi:hypothetical protein
MSKCHSILMLATCGMVLSGCVSHPKPASFSEQFQTAEASFNEKFPRTWPPKPLQNPPDQSEISVLTNMTAAVASRLKQSNVKFHNSGEFEIEIDPEGDSQLSTLAKDLRKDDIVVKYDALYFAKNPFSAGSFNDESKTFLVSHSALKDESSLRNLINHELVHVGTFRERTAKEPSPFYCRFRGKQFEPHYLACDEMKAYNSDIKNLVSASGSTETLKAKIQAARMHTEPIPSLIERLNLSSAIETNGVILIGGANKEGNFQMEIPDFVLVGTGGKKQARIKKHLDEVKRTAINYLAYISSVEQTK